MWDVFLLFAVPVGGGIPAGVVLAQTQGMGWLIMTVLYFISDVALALIFEPFMMLFGILCNHVEWLARMRDALKTVTKRTIAGYGASPGPIMLIAISFGIDPMTGRAAALASGHSFLSGWAIAIAGDMIFFGVIAVSTICLNNVIGDGTTASLIVMIAMFVIPPLIRRAYGFMKNR
ncbi:MAG: hypothetical protein H7249_17865 [Chitinophagaceae bacterium]|nr:hypothetical protein [Oligoflexus sp.]